MQNKNRRRGFIIIALCYLIAGSIGVFLYSQLTFPVWLSLLIADLVATFLIWTASLLFHNASVYDPYWSVQPVVILVLTLFSIHPVNIGSVLLFGVVTFWGVRLTANWAVTFPGLQEQDWRYDQLKNQSGKFFPLVNLFGIQVMPTLIVFLCVLPGFYFILRGGGLNSITMLGLLVALGGAVLEMTADAQMKAFKDQHQDRTMLIRNGVWKYSRHPNYLGEILVWWGVFVVMLSMHVDLWYLGAGALINTCLFLFISIPLAEKHLASYKTGFEQYRKETRMLLPFPKKVNHQTLSDNIAD